MACGRQSQVLFLPIPVPLTQHASRGPAQSLAVVLGVPIDAIFGGLALLAFRVDAAI